MNVSEYVTELYHTDDELLERLPAEAEKEGIPAIHIPDEVGRLLQVMIASSGARRVLELGTLFGYSSIWMARALPEDGHILTLEAQTKHAELSRRNLDVAGLASKVEVRVGNALETLPGLEGQVFDVIFIDADKVNYVHYLDWSLRLSRPGTVIIADNTWRHGDVLNRESPDGKALCEFNRRVATDDRLASAMITTRDGGDAVTVAVVRT